MLNDIRAFALSGTSLTQFDPANPAVGTTTAITGLSAGDVLVGIDFRPSNGMLYGVGVNPTTDTVTLYAISTRTGVATVVGVPGQITDAGGTPIDLPSGSYGIDFNPATDRLRIVTDTGLNFRINPNTGVPIDGDAGFAGPQPDGPINGATTTVDATAYTNNQLNSAVTTQYTLSAATDQLFIQNPPNSGTQTNPITITLGGSPLDFSSVNGFDIPVGVNAAAANAVVPAGSGLASLTVGGVTGLFSIDLVTGVATHLGNILDGSTAVNGLSIQADDGGTPVFAVSEDGSTLFRFNSATPTTSVSVALTGLLAGEKVMAIDFRPQTGQLYALVVDATANTGTIYIVDPQTGALTAVGTPGQIAFVDGVGSPVDLPTTGYGMDFNPTVDRIRVTTDSGLNFRINPNNGAPVDGNGNAPDGINPDGSITGLPLGSTGITATAYTNSFGQSLAGGVTTQYTLDADSNSLFIQNPPNAGTQTTQVHVTLGGSPLDFTGVAGFDIPPHVSVTASGAPADGFGFAALTVGGTVSLYRIDLTTGAATNLGAIGTGGVQLAGLTVGDAPAPVITSNGGGPAGAVSVAENTQAVTTVSATGDSASPTYSISGGADAARFVIDATTGALSFIAAPDFEEPADADGDNVYQVIVQASEVGLTDTQEIAVTVTNVGVTINGTPGNDIVKLGTTVPGQPLPTGEEDIIRGGAGSDRLVGLGGNDRLVGDAGNDNLFGSQGDDTHLGGAGNDSLRGGAGEDFLDGGAGINTAYYHDRPGPISVALKGSDLAFVRVNGVIEDTLRRVENVVGSRFDDTLVGDDNANRLVGGAGDDVLKGGAGDDVLVGGPGRDTLTGGAGADAFQFRSLADMGLGANRDVIIGFRPGTDQIELAPIPGRFTFLAAEGEGFNDVRGELRWFRVDAAGTANDKTIVAGDVNGDRTADFQIELTGLKMLSAADFLL